VTDILWQNLADTMNALEDAGCNIRTGYGLELYDFWSSGNDAPFVKWTGERWTVEHVS